MARELVARCGGWVSARARGARGAAGQAMVEYGIILAVVAMVVLIAATQLGTAVSGVFTRIVGHIGGIG
jgi:Flp pilus assembly pilin Flp